MKQSANPVVTTLIGGMVFLLPLVVVLLVLGQGLALTTRVAKPLTDMLPDKSVGGIALASIAAVALLLLLCFGAGVLARAAMGRTLTDSLVIVVTLSMALTPLAFVLNDVVIARWLRKPVEEKFDEIDAGENRVIIAGFGRVGQIVGRLLRAKRIAFTALDKSAEQVETVRRFGSRAYYGDASRLDMLLAAKADKAEILVVAIDDVESSLRTAETAKKHFPNLRIYARARNRFHAHRLMDIGVDYLIRETYVSSLELTQQVLRGLDLTEWEAQDAVATFRRHDEQFLASQHAVYHDETRLIQSSKEAVQELESLLQSDTEGDGGKSSLKAAPVFSPSDVR
jgi:glutathione-regulated potassium-efflux system ancillary protein KefC/glutathione-regulated potassium-efflux system protein KefB